jgi:hypothetical protein
MLISAAFSGPLLSCGFGFVAVVLDLENLKEIADLVKTRRTVGWAIGGADYADIGFKFGASSNWSQACVSIFRTAKIASSPVA